ncbi:MAG: hypothetical protein K8S14_09665 [Actinomycetia bacterium]|nr:hypothetical protein [Actinomycetes bacterium]
MRVFKNSDIKTVLIMITAILLITWMLPLGVLFADKDEEKILLEELTGESASAGEEGSIEVLGFTEENMPILGNKSLITVFAIVAAAVGGLFLSFVIKLRA